MATLDWERDLAAGFRMLNTQEQAIFNYNVNKILDLAELERKTLEQTNNIRVHNLKQVNPLIDHNYQRSSSQWHDESRAASTEFQHNAAESNRASKGGVIESRMRAAYSDMNTWMVGKDARYLSAGPVRIVVVRPSQQSQLHAQPQPISAPGNVFRPVHHNIIQRNTTPARRGPNLIHQRTAHLAPDSNQAGISSTSRYNYWRQIQERRQLDQISDPGVSSTSSSSPPSRKTPKKAKRQVN